MGSGGSKEDKKNKDNNSATQVKVENVKQVKNSKSNKNLPQENIKSMTVDPRIEKKVLAAKDHLSLLKNKIVQESTFSSKHHDSSTPQRLRGSQMSNYNTNSSPNPEKSKTYGLDEPEVLDNKRRVYGQYRAAPQYTQPDDKFSTGASISPRKAAIVPDGPGQSITLEPCPTCNRKFNPCNYYSFL